MGTQAQLHGYQGAAQRFATLQRRSVPQAGLRGQAEDTLRDVAYVLHLTRGLKQQILAEKSRCEALAN